LNQKLVANKIRAVALAFFNKCIGRQFSKFPENQIRVNVQERLENENAQNCL